MTDIIQPLIGYKVRLVYKRRYHLKQVEQMTDKQVSRPVKIAIMTISDSRTLEDDTSGQALVKMAEAEGHTIQERILVPDNIYRIRYEVSRWIIDEDVEVVITTGGTGLTGRDGTPEAVMPLFDRQIDGFGGLFRQLSYDTVGTSTIASRAVGGVANGTFVFTLPGSTGACKDGWKGILSQQLNVDNTPCNLVELMPRLTEV